MRLIQRILNELPFSKDELDDLVRTAQFRYKVFQIPKREKGKYRTIAQPTPEIKLLQRWLVDNIFSSLPIHRAAKAYRKSVSIAEHASIHAKQRFLLKMDFKNFFPSISVLDIRRYFIEVGKFSEEEARIISLLVCWRDKSSNKLCLSIGAPSSPHLSNVILYNFDKLVTAYCKENKVKYSRYADDLAFSTNSKETLSKVLAQIQIICSEIEYPCLEVNHSKTVSTSRAYKRVLTGLVLTSEGKVSLGRDKKRRLRSELYRFSKNQLEHELISKLRGELAFAWSVDNDFVLSLIRQNGEAVFRNLDLPFTRPE